MPRDSKRRGKKGTAEEELKADEKGDQPAVEREAAEAAMEEEPPADIQALEQELEKQKEQSKHHLEQWKRTAASLENYRKRVDRERAELIKSGQAALIAQLLPILDDFERAFQTLPFAPNSFTWTEGLALIDHKLQLVLMQQGLKEIDALGKPFDPARHQALLEEETTEYADGHVMAVLQKGYVLHDRVLRPAMVKIARNEAESKPRREAGQSTTDSAQPEEETASAAAEEQEQHEEVK
jgi:molecular chaperone GrpE